MAEEVSVLRLYVLRCMYLLNLALVGSGVVVEFVHRQEPWDPITGVAFSFWASLACLSALGIRYPLAMLPVIFMQLFYKTFWLLIVFAPLRAAGRSSDLTLGFVIAIILDVLVIPWTYVIAHYMKRAGDRWRQLEPAWRHLASAPESQGSITALLHPEHEDKVFNIGQSLMLGAVATMLWLAIMGTKERGGA